MNTPIVFIFYNKQQTTKQVFQKIKEMKPKKLYLVSDGPRKVKIKEKEVVEGLRKWVREQIDWDVSVCEIFSEENMGCKERIVSGLNQVFELEESAIILEDDCLPNSSFFMFCEDMLEYYKDAPQVMMVNGSSFAGKKHMMKGDYTFSHNVWIWGWATWRRAWKYYDKNVSTWPKVKCEPEFFWLVVTQPHFLFLF